jgi:hypothetical protein
MTGQIADSSTWRRKSYTLTGIDGAPLFDPADHGLKTEMWHTACYRGFVCDYSLRADGLFLRRLEVGVDPDGGAPSAIAGVEPEARPEAGRYRYSRMKLRVPFAGRLLLGRNFDPRRYQHMGFQDWRAYGVVLEATIDSNEVLVVDRTPELQSEAPPEEIDDLIRWIDRRFDRGPDLWGWP